MSRDSDGVILVISVEEKRIRQLHLVNNNDVPIEHAYGLSCDNDNDKDKVKHGQAVTVYVGRDDGVVSAYALDYGS